MKNLLLAAALVVPAWNGASAQDGSDIRVRVGLGAQLQPRFIGSDRRRLLPLFHINTARDGHEFSFSAPDDSPSIALVSTDGFSFGPAGNIEGRRRRSDVGAPVGNVATSFEVGAFAQYEAHDSFRVRAEILKAVNGSKGIVGSIGADKIWRDGDRYVFSIGPRILLSDARFERAYFGVSPSASLASGLPIYRPGGGVYGIALASGLSYQLGGGPWGLFGYARYERLVGDAAKSPIIREFGSRNQLSGGVGLNYTFTFHP
jgi:outer membrane protein